MFQISSHGGAAVCAFAILCGCVGAAYEMLLVSLSSGFSIKGLKVQYGLNGTLFLFLWWTCHVYWVILMMWGRMTDDSVIYDDLDVVICQVQYDILVSGLYGIGSEVNELYPWLSGSGPDVFSCDMIHLFCPYLHLLLSCVLCAASRLI